MFSRKERVDALEPLPEKQRLLIAFLVQRFPTISETFISRKVDFLLRNGHDVHVFCGSYDRSIEHPSEWRERIHVVHGWPVSDTLYAAARYIRALATAKINTKQLRDALREAKQGGQGRRQCIESISHLVNQRWDIIHAHFLPSLDDFTGLQHLLRCPVIGAVYGYDVTVRPYEKDGLRTLETEIAQVDSLTYSSKFLRKQLHSLLDTDNRTELILPPEVPIGAFPPRVRKTPHNPLRLLSVGRLAWAKGYPFALAAIRRLLVDGFDIEYRVVGEGRERGEIEFSIRNLNLSQHVHLEGGLSNERVAELMSWADIFVLPSVKEEFGVVLIEAQASGLPIVASRVGGVPEAICESETALLVRSHSPEELASAIKNLATHHDLFHRLSEKGPAFAKRFSSEKIGEQLVALYRRLMKHQIIDDSECRD